MSDMFNHIPINNRTEESKPKDYTKFNECTIKTIQLFELLHEFFKFGEDEYHSLKVGYNLHKYEQFSIKMDSIAAIAKHLNNEECKKAIKEGYRLYVTENKRYHN